MIVAATWIPLRTRQLKSKLGVGAKETRQGLRCRINGLLIRCVLKEMGRLLAALTREKRVQHTAATQPLQIAFFANDLCTGASPWPFIEALGCAHSKAR
jgi:hypothetical protein